MPFGCKRHGLCVADRKGRNATIVFTLAFGMKPKEKTHEDLYLHPANSVFLHRFPGPGCVLEPIADELEKQPDELGKLTDELEELTAKLG